MRAWPARPKACQNNPKARATPGLEGSIPSPASWLEIRVSHLSCRRHLAEGVANRAGCALADSSLGKGTEAHALPRRAAGQPDGESVSTRQRRRPLEAQGRRSTTLVLATIYSGVIAAAPATTPSPSSRPISASERPSTSASTSSVCSPSVGARWGASRSAAPKTIGEPGIR
jgi:hypothetical protein